MPRRGDTVRVKARADGQEPGGRGPGPVKVGMEGVLRGVNPYIVDFIGVTGWVAMEEELEFTVGDEDELTLQEQIDEILEDKEDKIQFSGKTKNIARRSEPTIIALAEFLAQHPEIVKASIEAHTANKEAQMCHLSVERAQAVEDVLVEYGVDRSRLRHKGFGSTQPIHEPGHPLNRRVEIKIVEVDESKVVVLPPKQTTEDSLGMSQSVLDATEPVVAGQRAGYKGLAKNIKVPSADEPEGECRFTDKRLREMFDMFDSDKSGEVDRDEAELLMQSAGLDPTPETFAEWFNSVDKDGSGRISFEEFARAMRANHTAPNSREEAVLAFKLFDTECMQKRGRKVLSLNRFWNTIQTVDQKATKEDVELVFKYCASSDKMAAGGYLDLNDWLRVTDVMSQPKMMAKVRLTSTERSASPLNSPAPAPMPAPQGEYSAIRDRARLRVSENIERADAR